MTPIEKLQLWYSNQCNGDWEHDFGIKIDTLDNPGWCLEINLQNTALQFAEFSLDNEISELDWYSIVAKNWIFKGQCDPFKLNFLIEYFLEEFVPKFFDPAFRYEILIPIDSFENRIWVMGYARMTKSDAFEIVEIGKLERSELMAVEFEQLEQNWQQLEQVKIQYELGELVNCKLVSTFQGNRLAVYKL